MDSWQIWRQALLRVAAASDEMMEKSIIKLFFYEVGFLLDKNVGKVRFICHTEYLYNSFAPYAYRFFSEVRHMLQQQDLGYSLELVGPKEYDYLKKSKQLPDRSFLNSISMEVPLDKSFGAPLYIKTNCILMPTAVSYITLPTGAAYAAVCGSAHPYVDRTAAAQSMAYQATVVADSSDSCFDVRNCIEGASVMDSSVSSRPEDCANDSVAASTASFQGRDIDLPEHHAPAYAEQDQTLPQHQAPSCTAEDLPRQAHCTSNTQDLPHPSVSNAQPRAFVEQFVADDRRSSFTQETSYTAISWDACDPSDFGTDPIIEHILSASVDEAPTYVTSIEKQLEENDGGSDLSEEEIITLDNDEPVRCDEDASEDDAVDDTDVIYQDERISLEIQRFSTGLDNDVVFEEDEDVKHDFTDENGNDIQFSVSEVQGVDNPYTTPDSSISSASHNEADEQVSFVSGVDQAIPQGESTFPQSYATFANGLSPKSLVDRRDLPIAAANDVVPSAQTSATYENKQAACAMDGAGIGVQDSSSSNAGLLATTFEQHHDESVYYSHHDKGMDYNCPATELGSDPRDLYGDYATCAFDEREFTEGAVPAELLDHNEYGQSSSSHDRECLNPYSDMPQCDDLDFAAAAVADTLVATALPVNSSAEVPVYSAVAPATASPVSPAQAMSAEPYAQAQDYARVQEQQYYAPQQNFAQHPCAQQPNVQPQEFEQQPSVQQQSFAQPQEFAQQPSVQQQSFAQPQEFVQQPSIQQQSFAQPQEFAQQPSVQQQSFVQPQEFAQPQQQYAQRQQAVPSQEYGQQQVQQQAPCMPQYAMQHDQYAAMQQQMQHDHYAAMQSQQQVFNNEHFAAMQSQQQMMMQHTMHSPMQPQMSQAAARQYQANAYAIPDRVDPNKSVNDMTPEELYCYYNEFKPIRYDANGNEIIEFLPEVDLPNQNQKQSRKAFSPALQPDEPIICPVAQINEDLNFSNFVYDTSNVEVIKTAKAICAHIGSESYNQLYLYGDPGTGKSHLLHAMAVEMIYSGAVRPDEIAFIRCKDFVRHYISIIAEMQKKRFSNQQVYFHKAFLDKRVLFFEDLQTLSGAVKSLEVFYSIISAFLDRPGTQMIACGDVPPAKLCKYGYDGQLLSRIQGGLSLEVKPASAACRRVMIERRCRERNKQLTPEVVDYLVSRLSSDVRELNGALKTLFSQHPNPNQEITISDAMRCMSRFSCNNRPEITMNDVMEIAAKELNVTVKDILSARKKKPISIARSLAMTACRDFFKDKSSLNDIGRAFSKDHSSVHEAIQRTRSRMQLDNEMQEHYHAIMHAISKLQS